MSRSARARAGSPGAADANAAPTAEEPTDAPPAEPCLHCGHPVALRLMGCKGGHCPNCRHPYPHGDCSD